MNNNPAGMSAARRFVASFVKVAALVPGRRPGSKSPGGCETGDPYVNDACDGQFLAVTAGEF